ncbi:MAG: CARDB domain-containing protein, partial [Persicimonas sp.]
MSRRNISIVLAFFLVAALGVSACGGTDGEAEVTIESVDPTNSYPGVRTDVVFNIEPGEGVSEDQISWVVNFGDGTSVEGDGTEGEESNTYEDPGEFPLEVVAMVDGEEAGSATETVSILEPIDLVVDDVQGSPANIEVEEELDVDFEVFENDGGSIRSEFDVSFFLSESSSVDLESLQEEEEELVPLGTATIEAEEEGEAVVESGATLDGLESVEIPEDVSSGSYRVVAWVNPEDQLADEDEENNFSVSNSDIRVENPEDVLPDPAVQEVTLRPERAFPEMGQVQTSFTVDNRGAEDAFDIVAELWLSEGDDELDEDEDTRLGETDPFEVPGNDDETIGPDEYVLDDPIQPPSDGESEVYLIVSLEMDGEEASEDNNIGVSEASTVSDEPLDGIDVAVRDFSISPHSTFLDGSLETQMTLANEGTEDAGSFFCGIYLADEPRVDTDNDERLTNINISSLDSEEEEEIEREFTVPGTNDPGDYYLYVVCDPVGALEEPIRSNNQQVYSEEISITDEADVDLYVDELSVPEEVEHGEEFDLTATICVAGSNPPGRTEGLLYRQVDEMPTFEEDPVDEFEVPNIEPNECEDVTIETTAECEDFEDNYGYGIEVDAGDSVPENDEDNNEETADTLMTFNGEYCSCEDDGRGNDSAGDAYPVGDGVSSESVCESEGCDYYQTDLTDGQSLLVTTTYDDEYGDLETELFDSSGVSTIDYSDTDGHQEVATFLNDGDSRYKYSVCGQTSSDQNLYDLDVQVIDPSPDADLVAHNLEIPEDGSYSIGSEFDITFDVYNVGQADVDEAVDANLVVSPDNTIGNSDDIALDPSSISIDPIDGESSTEVEATVTIPDTVDDDDYYLGVELDFEDADTGNNTARSQPLTVETLCYDPLEPNSYPDQARKVDDGEYNNLVACTEEDDYYEICANNGDQVDASVTFDEVDGDLDLELYDDENDIIDSSTSASSGQEEVSVDYVNGDQCYYLRVPLLSVDDEDQVDYDMDVDIEEAPEELQCDGRLEPNDTPDTAASYLSATTLDTSLDRCPSDDIDYYYLNLSSGQTVDLSATLEDSQSSGTLRLQLYDNNGSPEENQETGPGQDTAEIEDYTAPTSGTYHVEVTVGGSDRNVPY